MFGNPSQDRDPIVSVPSGVELGEFIDSRTDRSASVSIGRIGAGFGIQVEMNTCLWGRQPSSP